MRFKLCITAKVTKIKVSISQWKVSLVHWFECENTKGSKKLSEQQVHTCYTFQKLPPEFPHKINWERAIIIFSEKIIQTWSKHLKHLLKPSKTIYSLQCPNYLKDDSSMMHYLYAKKKRAVAYNTDMVAIVKPIPYFDTAAESSKPTQSTNHNGCIRNWDTWWKWKGPYWQPFLSYLPSNWSTSISTIAASRYFLMLRTTFIATMSLASLSQHSNTCPNVPAHKAG